MFSHSFGACEVYDFETEVCDGVLRHGIDYVYSSKGLGTQSSISEALNENFELVRDVISTHSQYCVDQVLRLVCAYYLPRCGNSTHNQFPPSICQEECLYTETTCSSTWEAVSSAFSSLDSFLVCEDPSCLLFPLPHCCTEAGIYLYTTAGGL